jgi:PPIC-type PPIASE domain/SurA N-terminal domain
MKKPKKPKLKRPQLPTRLPTRLKRRQAATEKKMSEALSDVPRITNETVGEHREEVLSSARKYIYPLQHSKHHIVRISISLLVAVIIIFLGLVTLDLYKFQGTSGFVYDVTKLVPFPVGKTGGHWIRYESYLFELRRNMHYYVSQQQSDFKTRDGKTQLKRLKQQELAQVTQDAYVKQLAAQHGVTVSAAAVNTQLELVRSENRLGSSDRAFHEVLSEFWGWNESDFRRELKQQLLTQAVVTKLDTATTQKAQAALGQLQHGTDFATLAGQVSDDTTTKGSGGQYPSAITINDLSVPPAITDQLFKMKPGQVSGIINTGFSLDIVKLVDKSGSAVHAAHIQFTLQPIMTYTKPLQAKQPPHYYISVK